MKVEYYVDLYPGWHLNGNNFVPCVLSSPPYTRQPANKLIRVVVDLPEFGGEDFTVEGKAEEARP